MNAILAPQAAVADNASLQQRRAASVARAIGSAHTMFASRAENALIWDVEGRRYIDFCAGIAVCNTGHVHPRLKAALHAQIDQYTHTCFQVTAYESYIELAERLCAAAPGSQPKKAFFMSTGAEAVENAVKVARYATGRSAVISFEGGFHGRTLLGMTLTAKVAPYKAGFGPLVPDVYHVPFPSPVHGTSVADSLDALAHLFKFQVDAKRVAAIIVEPVQGEGGYIPAPEGLLAALRAVCDEHGILLIADEIQTGIGRTGKLFAVEHSGVVPDLITLAKGLGGGTPISGVVGRADIIDAVPPGGLGSTYAGSPLATTAALTVLDIIEDEGLLARATAIGERMRSRFRALAKRHRSIADVRGLGAMTGVELSIDGDLSRPATELAAALKTEAAKRGLIVLTCGNSNNVIRMMPALTIEDAVLDEGLDIIEQSLAAIQAG